MKRPIFIVRALAACALLAAACGDNHGQGPRDAAPPADASIDGAVPGANGPCLDRPTDLALAPTAGLPCDLLPPGFEPPR